MGGTLTFTSVRTRPWHAGAPGLSRPPPTLKEASKTIKNYGWYFDFASVCTRPWHVGAPGLSRPPPTLKKAAKTIKSYGWCSGPCLGATIGQVWNS